MPSVSPSVTVSCLLPQPAADSAHASTAEITTRRLMARMLDARHRRALAAVVVLLEDRLEPGERLAAAALEPAPEPERLHDAVGRQLRLDLRRVLDLGASARRRQRPGVERLVAVELAAAAGGHDPEGSIHLDEGHVGPAEAVEAPVVAEPGARTVSDRVEARQVPVLEVVVAELGVVGDVREVVEDLLAGPADRDRAGDGVHGGRESNGRRAGQAALGLSFSAALTARRCSGECTTTVSAGGSRRRWRQSWHTSRSP